jgi:hypothetical protein
MPETSRHAGSVRQELGPVLDPEPGAGQAVA